MKKLITNNTENLKFYNSVLIHPNESRLVPVIASAVKHQFDPSSIISLKVSEIKTRLNVLTIDELSQLKVAEESNQSRQSAIKLIDAEIEKREYDNELSEFALTLSSIDNLDELQLEVADDEVKLAMVEQEIESRAEKLKDDNQ
ncbi:hypothetical protein [Alteromonas sp. C1M14]|uniref:hypothetical protein n=1 Tax=Alteromonas sp. C1M14 TaxID=2841567 RepID=UPI001C08879B|nr:hypothetical protein [Alteromonas sp. C1M14]MBU2979012.1 hypothetical protein [Alteromonas sp. C1M14]